MASSSPAGCQDVFCFWTNKGGVGKTTLTFHSAVAYARTNPDKQVIVCDCDSQANLSRTLLTQVGNSWNDEAKKDSREGADVMKCLQEESVCGRFPKTILGFFMARYDFCAGVHMSAADLLVDVHHYNSNMPDNLKLICGDQRLQCIVDDIMNAVMRPSHFEVKWVTERTHLRTFLDLAARLDGRETVVFIDTNPTLDIFTEIALVCSTKLVVPVMFDDYSTAALRNMIYLLHGLGRTSVPHLQKYEETVFWSRARQHKVKLPRIQTVIFNRTAGVEIKKAEAAILDEQYHLLFQLMTEIEASPDIKLEEVFNLAAKPPNYEAVNEMCCFMRDMYSAGIISMRCGLPLWTIKRHAKSLQECMGVASAPSQSSIDTTLQQLIGSGIGKSVLQALTSGHDALGCISQEHIDEALDEASAPANRAWGPPAKRPRPASLD